MLVMTFIFTSWVSGQCVSVIVEVKQKSVIEVITKERAKPAGLLFTGFEDLRCFAAVRGIAQVCSPLLKVDAH